MSSTGNWEDAVRRLITDPSQRALVEACYFDPPLAAATRRYHQSEEWADIRAMLPPPPASVLDLGAGNGIVVTALARDGYHASAVEPDPSALVGAQAIRDVAAEEGLEISVTEAMGEGLPFDDNTFDAIIARQVLHHAQHLHGFCREMARITRSGGTVITLRDHVIDSPESHAAFLEKHPLHHLYGGENAFLLFEYEAALVQAGLRIERRIGPFDGAVNMFPNTPDDIRLEIADRLASTPILGPALGWIVKTTPFSALKVALNLMDRRPGRLYSFVCVKT